MGDPGIPALSEGTDITPTVRGARLPPSIPWSWSSHPGRHGHCGDVATLQEKTPPRGSWSAMPVVACVAISALHPAYPQPAGPSWI